ncbi:MAG: fimbrial protein FimV [Methylomonas sp.]|uniref:FimV/HubP family polar landmark protein n=1 Tax=Methylomonas sp. TaxID=418 RepID=UPI0025D0DF57|nr:FimV/HubP family polar landmark protein [Methylomonas sp.]MCK9605269.1 fimbrial protein FimV [Methylomonas sp.]
MKHLTKTLAVVSLLAPMSAQPLGIGDIELHSALNQKLNAEIHLRLAAGENPADVSVKLAPPEKFDQAGVPWNYFLSKIKFNPVVQANGSIVVKITSREPLTEPFLDFLLEVSWPQGSQYREFTVLVDPPEAYRAPVTPSTFNADYRVEPLEDYSRPARKTQTGRKSVRQVRAAANITPQTPTSGEYGPVQTADTLWRIADQLGNERGVPTNQMMAALFRANPDAFNRGNIDSLKAGAVLKIPATDAILQSSGERKPTRKTSKPTTDSVAANKALELIAPTEAKITENTSPVGQVKPGQEQGESPASGEGASGATSDGKDLELQSRIDRLEQQLNMMQQLLALKDQQLAALQSNDQQAAQQAAESAQKLPTQQTEPVEPEATAQPETVPPLEESTPAGVTPQPPAEVKPTPPAVEAPKQVKPVPPPPPPPVDEESFFSSSTYSMAIGGLSLGIIGLLGWLLWRKRKIESQTNTESMFASASQIRMPDSDSSLSVPVMDINSTGAYDVGTVGESSFISDFTPSDFEAFDTDQSDIDPMSEADVYLAYGRYQQAEDLIRQAIKEQPDKDDYKLKLLEIFYANENKERFAEYTQELAEAGKNADRSFWNKVSDMAKEIIPESTLFGGLATAVNQKSPQSPAAQPHDVQSSQPANFETDDDDFNFEAASTNDDLIDLKAPTLPDMELMDEINSELAEMQLTLPDDESDNSSLDFDLSSFDKPTNKAEATDQPIEPVADIESIDFDLSGLSDSGTEATEDADGKASATLESFDFNFDLDSTPSAADKASDGEAPAKSDEPLDMASLESFEFPEFGEDEPEEKPAPAATPAPAEPLSEAVSESADEFDFNFDFETLGGESIDDDIDFGVSDLTDMDEFETKIDLAKAYIDMGDAEAAKSIATEVLEKGTPEQKQAAQALLDELK